MRTTESNHRLWLLIGWWCVAVTPASAGVSNDNCAEAQSVTDGSPAASGDNALASEDDAVEASCFPFADHDVWFNYQATCSGSAVVDTLGSDQADTVLSIYDACGGDEIACNDDAGSLLSSVAFIVTAGQSYAIRLASVGDPGDYDLNIACIGPPANDACADATPVVPGSPAATGNNLQASMNDDMEASCQLSDQDVWFALTSTCQGDVVIDTFGSGQADTVLSVYDDCGGQELACSDDVNGLHAEVSVPTIPGDGLLIRVASIGTAGDYVLNIDCAIGDPGPCTTHGDCADLDANGIRDDVCVFWACESGGCVGTDVAHGDMGGSFGDCAADGGVDGNDRFHANNCFSNVDFGGLSGYPCEVAVPQAYNVDVAGQGAPCEPDGVCDGHDAFAALNTFAGISTCSCSEIDPAPSTPPIVDEITIELLPGNLRAHVGDVIEIDVTIADSVRHLRGYQLHPVASPGLQLVDMFIDQRADHVFFGMAFWDAYNLRSGQMLAGIDTEGITSTRDVYLATLVYRVRKGGDEMMVDLHADTVNGPSTERVAGPAPPVIEGRTFMFATPQAGYIEIAETVPAVITVEGRDVSTGGDMHMWTR